MTCINCGNNADGTFCNQCGQKLQVKRLTFKEGWFDFWARIYGFDGQFPRTFRDITLRPGFAAREFIKGNRARYYGPVGYFFLMITCFLLLLSLIDLSFVDYMKVMQKSLPVNQGQGQEKLNAMVATFISDNLKTFSFMYIPLQAFTSRFIFFRKQGLNFLEHTVLPFYVFGHWYWFTMVEVLLYKITGMSVGAEWQLLIMSFYVAFAYSTFAAGQSKIKAFFKGLGVYYVSYMILMIVAFISGIVMIAILMKTDPDLVKELIKK